MSRNLRCANGMTLIELVVVVAVLGLLLALLGPGLQAARQQSGRSGCLDNLRAIGAATQAYALDDPKEFIMPIHQMMRRQTRNIFRGSCWGWRHANWFVWGGKTCTERYFCVCADDRPACGPILGLAGSNAEVYAAETRPLNPYVPGLETYHCPADVGYPDTPWVGDSPSSNAERVCFDTLGNSYRGSLFCYIDDTRAFTMGPWGHRLSTLYELERLVLLGDPLFFSMIGFAGNQPFSGWHGDVDNVLYCDGSARPTPSILLVPTNIREYEEFKDEVGPYFGLISRGVGFNFDCYPTPGARIWGNVPFGGDDWPFADYQDNME